MPGVASLLDTSRQTLLDLSTRNRLLSTPRKSKSAKTIEVVGEQSAHVFQILVKDNKAVSFLPVDEDGLRMISVNVKQYSAM